MKPQVRIFRLVCLSLGLAGLLPAASFRTDRISLDGSWKFQLRRDNRLVQPGPVRFGPVSASSQAVFIEPWPGQSQAGRWRTAVPWPLSATLTGPSGPGFVPQGRQIWRPHRGQLGPTWWEADLGTPQTLRAVRLHWYRPGQVSVTVATALDDGVWSPWSEARSVPADSDTTISGPARSARRVRLTFTPSQFDGTGKIDIVLGRADGSLVPWEPVVQRVWYDQLRRFTPADGFERPSFDDSSWKPIHVPGYWEVQRFSEPTWWQPDDTVGYYRRRFTPPSDWRGRQVRLRFEGVNNAAQVWVNGVEVGYHESGFTAFEYDITALLRFGVPNHLAVRVSKWTLTHEYDTDDAWFLGGIWREAYLYSLPSTRIDDYLLRTTFDHRYRDAVLHATLKLHSDSPALCQIEGELLDPQGASVPMEGFHAGLQVIAGPQTVDLAGLVRNPAHWTAETPRLYRLTLRLRSNGGVLHEFSQAIGFRQVEVKGHSILLNGVPILIRGVVTTRANPRDSLEPRDQVFQREIRLLKESNINTIRSHTTPLEEDFLDLCDRYGIYVIPDVPYVWVQEEDFCFLTDGAVDRARDIYEQHKNRTSVIFWHIGNENGVSSSARGMGRAARWLHEADPSRPVTVCSNRASLSEFGAAITDEHYYPLRREVFLQPQHEPVLFGEFHALPEIAGRLRDSGLVETWGRSLKLEWAEFEKRPWVAGGLICCWDDGSVNGNLGPRQWGALDSRRQPKPVYPQIRDVFSPLRFAWDGTTLSVTNHFRFSDLAGFEIRYELRDADRPIASNTIRTTVAPGSAKTLSLPAGAADRLCVTVIDDQGFRITDQELRKPDKNAPASARALLERLGLTRLQSPAPRLLDVPGVIVQHSQGWDYNQPLGQPHYAPASSDGARTFTLSAPQAMLKGEIRVQSGPSWQHVAYRFVTDRELTISESGIELRLPDDFTALAWNRDAFLGDSLGHAPFDALRRAGSLRRVYWALIESASSVYLLVPDGHITNLRASASGTLIVSDFLGGDDFLGRFDGLPVDCKVTPSAGFHGGFTLYRLTPAQAALFARLSPREKDLTWPCTLAPSAGL
jgi:hypothetical protein